MFNRVFKMLLWVLIFNKRKDTQSIVFVIFSLLSLSGCSDQQSSTAIAVQTQPPASLYTRTLKELTSTIQTPRQKSIVNSFNIKQARVHSNNYFARNMPQGRAVTNKRGTYGKDYPLWVYNTEFAERFGMPPEWVDNSIKGAEALAYRVDWDVGGVHCLTAKSGDDDNNSQCRPKSVCVVDAYISDAPSIPWLTERTHDSLYGRKSERWLNARIGQPRVLKPINGVALARGQDAALVSGDFVAYDKEVYRALNYLSVSFNCAQLTGLEQNDGHRLLLGDTSSPYSINIPAVLISEIKAWHQQAEHYAELFLPEGEDTKYQDDHVWAYSADFAQRYNLPAQWIDPQLQGAEAVAYRVDWDNLGTKCGYFSNLENCRPAPACIVDIYMHSTTNLPWNSPTRHDSRYGHKTKTFMYAQRDKDKPAYLYRRTRRGTGAFSYRMGLDGVFSESGKHGGNFLGGISIMEYDRDLSGLQYLSGMTTCGGFGRSRDMKIKIDKVTVFHENGRMDARAPTNIVHQVAMSNDFMQRVSAYDQWVYAPNSLFNALKENLSQQSNPTDAQ